MPKVYTIGETVFDIIFELNQPVAAKAGGSMLNASVSLGRLGLPVQFISEYGTDKVGKVIDDFLLNNGVSTDFVNRFTNGQSPLALAFLDDNKNANYDFYKIYPKNRMEIGFPDILKDDILLFGSFYALISEVRPYLIGLLEKAKAAGAIIIYDPNFRSAHLAELEKLRPSIVENLQYADIVRGSDEDFELIFNVHTAEETFDIIKQYADNLIYTASNKSAKLICNEFKIEVTVPQIETVSTIGAGDTFNSGLIYSLLTINAQKENINFISPENWKFILQNAIHFASNVCMSYDNYISVEFEKIFKTN